MAERVGFEPTVPFRTTVFETSKIPKVRMMEVLIKTNVPLI